MDLNDTAAPVSSAVSAQYNITCPVCAAGPLLPCRTLKTGRVTDTHLKRIDVAYPALGVVLASRKVARS